MSKRSNTSKEALPAKRTRLALGFRLARPPPQATPSQPTHPGNTSLFITVNQPDERRGILQAQHRVLSSTFGDPAETSTPNSPVPPPPPTLEDSALPFELIDDTQNPTVPQEELTVKPKRKRYTTNAVSLVPY